MTYPFDPRLLELEPTYADDQVRLTERQRLLLIRLLTDIWPGHDAAVIQAQFEDIVREARRRVSVDQCAASGGWSEQQMALICYGDHLRSRDPQQPPLRVLSEFCRAHFHEPEFDQLTLHLLPIYASPCKDGGFDVADPFAVNPAMGTWADVRAITRHARLALDFVANHLSTASAWFTRYMQDDPRYRDFFIGFDDEAAVRRLERDALPHIHRPRPHNPFIPVTKPDGSTRWVYMTFSDHQADVNYGNPFVFLKMLEVLAFYIIQGASLLRLDAIPYLWKDWGTPCAHHPNTHALLELFRLAVDLINPDVKLLAESMEPLADSQRYLSTAEAAKAHLAYNFVPCGLIPHTLLTADATVFQRNLAHFQPPGLEVNWAVVCGVTHDGSSLNPCRAPQNAPGQAVLTEAQIAAVADAYAAQGRREIAARAALPPEHPQHLSPAFEADFVARHGESPRFANYKVGTDAHGQPHRLVYEAISTYASLFDQQPDPIVAAVALALGLPGVPFLYFTLPFALLNDYAGYLATGNPRELNRGRVIAEDLRRELSDADTLASQVFWRCHHLLRLRAAQPAFHPAGRCLPGETGNAAVIAFLRVSPDETLPIVIVQNVSTNTHDVRIHLDTEISDGEWSDIISGRTFPIRNRTLDLTLAPFAILWLKPQLDGGAHVIYPQKKQRF